LLPWQYIAGGKDDSFQQPVGALQTRDSLLPDGYSVHGQSLSFIIREFCDTVRAEHEVFGPQRQHQG
jgi:hypothetical protein